MSDDLVLARHPADVAEGAPRPAPRRPFLRLFAHGLPSFAGGAPSWGPRLQVISSLLVAIRPANAERIDSSWRISKVGPRLRRRDARVTRMNPRACTRTYEPLPTTSTSRSGL